jgi:predicted GNAT superfamily acetyltransferase
MSEAWDLAGEAARTAGVALRPLDNLEDADAINGVIRATWGGQELDREVIKALVESGNVAWGATVDDELVGFVLGWAGVTPEDGLHVHSHMLATVPDMRHRGAGFALKLAQRAQALDQGMTLVRWTFDPLLARNAWFNLAKLGATADRFEEHFYGDMADELNRGERSDRLVVRWDLDRMTAGARADDGFEVLGRAGDEALPRPTDVRAPATARCLVRIPREYHDLRERDRSLAEAWREASSDALRRCFDAGLIVTGFTETTSYVCTPSGESA